MAGDLGLTNAQRDAFFRDKFGLVVRALETLEAQQRYAKYARAMVVEQHDPDNRLSGWALTEGRLHLDTDSDGRVYIKIVANGPNWNIEFHKNSARTLKVAEATNVANGATGTIVAVSGFKLAGTVKLATGAAVSNIEIRLRFDFRREVEGLLLDAETDENVKGLKDALSDEWNRRVATNFQRSLDQFKTAVDTAFWADYVADFLGLSQQERDEGLVTVVYTDDASGRVVNRVRGIIESLSDSMADNTGGSGAIHVKRNVVTVGAVVKDPDNVGDLTPTVQTREHLQTGKLILECVDETIGEEKFDISLQLATEDPYGRDVLRFAAQGEAGLVVEDYAVGAKVTLTRNPVETGDDGAILSNHNEVGISAANSDGGKLYITITRNAAPPQFTLKVYKASTLDAANLVGTADITGLAGPIGISVTGQGLTYTATFDRTAAAAHLPAPGNQDLDIVVNFRVSKVGDRYTFQITNDMAGRFQRFMARWYNTSIHSSATPSVDDNFAHVPPVVTENP